MNPYLMTCEKCKQGFEITRKEEYLMESALCVPLPTECQKCRAEEKQKKAEHHAVLYT